MKVTELLTLIEGIENKDIDIKEVKEIQSYLDSENDKYSSKSLETWKTNNLNKLIEAEILKRNPAKTPEQIKIEELEAKFSEMEKAKSRAEMTAKFKDVLTEKNIPGNMVDFLLSDTEELTDANITLFEESMKGYIESKVTERLGTHQYTPPKDDGGKGKSTYEDLLNNADNMTAEQIAEQFSKLK